MEAGEGLQVLGPFEWGRVRWHLGQQSRLGSRSLSLACVSSSEILREEVEEVHLGQNVVGLALACWTLMLQKRKSERKKE